MHTLSPHLEQKLHAIFMGSNINCGQWQCVLIFDHVTFSSVGVTIRTTTMEQFFPCNNATGHLTWPLDNLSPDELHHFNASQTYIDHVHKSTEKHQELQLQLLKIKDQVLLYSLQPLAAPTQATRMHQLFKHLLKDHFSKPFLEHPKEQWPPFLLVVWCQVLKISSWKMIPFLNLCYYFLYCLMTSTWRYRLL